MKSIGVAVAAAAFVAIAAPAAHAQDPLWNERTVLQFDRPVMIPGKVLQPGTYIFQLADTRADRNIIEVYKANPDEPDQGRDLVATTLTVPTKRARPNGDVVLKFANTEGAEPIALKAFFYPGTLRGHEFVYSQPEAQKIAQQTHKLVLSHDIKGTDKESGTLYTTDENGTRTAWQQDPVVAREWAAWVVTRHPERHANARSTASDTHNGSTVGTTGRTMDHGKAGMNDHTMMTAEQHAKAIQRLTDQALHASGSTITIDRSTLEQIRSHAEAIEHNGGKR